MDASDNNNQCDSVNEPMSVKSELKEERDLDNPNQVVRLSQTNLYRFHENSTDSISIGLKRKHSEENSLNVEEDERMSDTSSSSKANVKRRRYSNSQDNVLDSTQGSYDRAHFIVSVTNSPGEWTSQEIIDYVKEHCGMNISKINDSRDGNSSDFQIKLKFASKEQLDEVLSKLKEKEAEGKLTANVEDTNGDSQSEAASDNTLNSDERGAEQIDESSSQEQDADPYDNAFHIKEDYLQSLGIKLPLTNWVTVTNFRCDKSELKEVLDLCGKVLVCSVITLCPRYANVMYSHPLEAVQAISMLNGQKFYGKPLKLAMNNIMDGKTLLPKGLHDVGPGLGKFGKPIPDLEEQYKRFLQGLKSSIDAHLFQQELLNKIGITLEEDNYIRPGNNSLNNDDNTSDSQSRESSPSAQNLSNQIVIISHRLPRPQSIPLTRPQFHNNPITNFSRQSVSAIIRPNGPRLPRGPSGPNITPRPPQHSHIVQNCPPIPGVDSNDPRNFNGLVQTGPMSVPMSQPRLIRPMIGPNVIPSCPPPPRISGPVNHVNRFPGPGSPMLGPRPIGPVGPASLGPRGPGPHGLMPSPNVPVPRPINLAGNFRPQVPAYNVQMFKSNDPVTLQISNLPPTTNFVNLGQKLSELGHVVFLEFTTPGCAIVRFASPSDAERCFQNYRKVLG